jgi:hypothetical protein
MMSPATLVIFCLAIASLPNLPEAHWTLQRQWSPTLLEGVYVSDYHCGEQCKDEIINVYHTSVNETGVLVGIKVKGDEWVPAGEVTFIAEIVSRRTIVTAAQSNFTSPVCSHQFIDFLNDTCFVIDASVHSMNKPIYYHKTRNFDNKQDRQLHDMLLVASTNNKNGQTAKAAATCVQRASEPSNTTNATLQNPCAQCPEMVEINERRRHDSELWHSFSHDSAWEFDRKYPGGKFEIFMTLVPVIFLLFCVVYTMCNLCCGRRNH